MGDYRQQQKIFESSVLWKLPWILDYKIYAIIADDISGKDLANRPYSVHVSGLRAFFTRLGGMSMM